MIKKALFFLLFFYTASAAQTLLIDGPRFDFDRFSVDKRVEGNHTRPIEAVTAAPFDQKVGNAYSNGFVAHRTIWHRFSMINRLSVPVEVIVSDGFYFLPVTRDVFVTNTQNEIVARFDKSHGAHLQLSLLPHETYTLYAQSYFLDGISSMFHFRVADVVSTVERLAYENILLALLLGGMATLIIYNFMIFIYTKERIYAYYVAYLFCSFVIGFVFISGFAHLFFELTDATWIYAATYATPFTMIFIMLFTARLFETATHYPVLNRWLVGASAGMAGYVMASMIFGLLSLMPVVLGFGMIIGFAIVGMGIYMTYTKHLFGPIYLASTATYAGFALITIVYFLGLLPTNFLTSNALLIGSLIEGFGLSLLLAYRINVLTDHNHRLEILSSIDTLTQIYNRRTILARLEAALSHEGVGVLMIDIDHFKNINDRYGHDVGDKALVHTADILRRSLSGSQIGRIGGEEFLVVKAHTNKRELVACAENLRRMIEETPLEGYEEMGLSISIGMTLSEPSSTAKTLLKTADIALYRAKEEGRNRAVFLTQ